MVEAKIYGIQRSGTNWYHLLLEKNYKISLLTTNESGRKHAPYNIKQRLGRDAHALVVVKHPLAWLTSIRRFDYPDSKLNNIIMYETKRWNDFYNKFLQLRIPGKHRVFVKYEDLLVNAQNICDRNMSLVQAPRITQQFYVPRKTMNKNNTESKDAFNVNYYIKKLYLREYTYRDLNKVRKWINKDLLTRLGYGRF